MTRDDAYYLAAQKECPRCGIPCVCHLRRPAPPTVPTALPPAPSLLAEYVAARELHAAHLASQRCGIREGETLAELITRLYAETLEDR